MVRIFLEREETVEDALRKISVAKDADVVLVVPKESALIEEEGAFAYIAKSMKAKKKRVRVESVDERILELATGGGLEGVHPFFGENRGKPIVDIVSRGKKKAGVARGKGKVTSKGKEKSSHAEEVEERPPVSVSVMHEPLEEKPAVADVPMARSDVDALPKKRRLGRGVTSIFLIGIALVVVGYGSTILFWSKVDIVIDLQKKSWNKSVEMRATKIASVVAQGSLVIPGEVFTLDRNTTELYPATGRSAVSKSATGKLIIYNEFGVQPQTLVARTRFLAPDGKIFRLTKTITVPGAKLTNGKLTPSSIETTVMADGVGPTYNIGSVPRLSIPGFEGTSKANGFYGAMPNGASGGIVGEHAVPTTQDIAAAKIKVEEQLRAVLVGTVKSSMPDDFTLLDDAIRISMTKITVNSSTDAQGNFSVFGAAQMKAVGFREIDVKKAAEMLAQKEEPTMVFRETQFSYTAVKPRFDVGDVTFTVAIAGTLWTNFDTWAFEKTALGKGLDEVRGMIGRTPGVTGGSVSVWPQFGVLKVPGNEKRVTVAVK